VPEPPTAIVLSSSSMSIILSNINDTWGHAAGDAALREVGQRLRTGIRKDDGIGRYGGEEFAILLSDIEQQDAFDLAERLRGSIAEAPCLWQQEGTQTAIRIPPHRQLRPGNLPPSMDSSPESYLRWQIVRCIWPNTAGAIGSVSQMMVDMTALKGEKKQQGPQL